MNLSQHVASLQARQTSTKADMRHRAEKIRDELKTFMQAELSGTLTEKDRIAMGYPYARGPGNRRQRTVRARYIASHSGLGLTAQNTAPKLPINYEHGNLYNALHVDLTENGNTVTVTAWFDDVPELYVLQAGGTKNMVARGFRSAVNRFLRTRLSRIM